MSFNSLIPLSFLISLPNTFRNKDEVIYFHKEVQARDAQLKFRKELDLGYAKLRLEKLIEDKKEYDFQKEFAENRNEKILNDLQKDIFKNISTANITEQSKTKLDQYKNKYSEYLNYHRTHIQREFNYQILVKQNALIAEKAILSNQLVQNEKMLKMENEYCEKIHKTNITLIEEIKRLQLQNDKINEERQRKALNHQTLENKLAKEMNEKGKEEMKESMELGKNNFITESYIQQDSQRRKKTKVTVETEIALNLNHKYGKLDQIRQSHLDQYIRKQKEEKDMEKTTLNNTNKTSSQFKPNTSTFLQTDNNKDTTYKNSMFKQDQNTPLTNIYNKNMERKQNTIVEEINKSREVSFGENSINQKNEFVSQLINPLKVKPLQASISSHSNTNKLKESHVVDPLESIKLSQSIEIPQNLTNKSIKIPDKQQLKDLITSNKPIEVSKVAQKKPSEKNIEPILERQDSNEFDPYDDLKESKQIKESQAINKNELKESIVTYTHDQNHYDNIIESKPSLKSKLVLPEYKMLVLKKLILKIEKYAKTQKNVKQIYTMKNTNIKDIEDQLKEKFYSLLSSIKEDKGCEEEFALLDLNMALNLIFELLSSNPNSNLNESNLGSTKKVYDEEVFINDIDDKYKDVIKAILDHMRTMITIKKISLQLACSFMVKGLLNFNHTEVMKSKLLSILEMHLTQKKNTPIANTMSFANTFSSGFNVSTKVFHQSNTKLPPTNSLIHSSNLKKTKNNDNIFEQYE